MVSIVNGRGGAEEALPAPGCPPPRSCPAEKCLPLACRSTTFTSSSATAASYIWLSSTRRPRFCALAFSARSSVITATLSTTSYWMKSIVGSPTCRAWVWPGGPPLGRIVSATPCATPPDLHTVGSGPKDSGTGECRRTRDERRRHEGRGAGHDGLRPVAGRARRRRLVEARRRARHAHRQAG